MSPPTRAIVILKFLRNNPQPRATCLTLEHNNIHVGIGVWMGGGEAEALLPEKKGLRGKRDKDAYKMDNKTCTEIFVYKPIYLFRGIAQRCL